MKDKFLVYENWTAEKKAVVHHESCRHANEGNEKHKEKWLQNNHAPNDRWFGYFSTLEEAIAFASLLPYRQLKLCGHCLKNEKDQL